MAAPNVPPKIKMSGAGNMIDIGLAPSITIMIRRAMVAMTMPRMVAGSAPPWSLW